MWHPKSRVWLVLLFAAAVYFVVRGPWRALHDSGDFLTLFCAARSWAHGMNPYAPADLLTSARSAGAPASMDQFRIVPSFYFPSAYPFLAPFALLPWTLAKIVWLCCSLAATWWAGKAVVSMTKASAAAIWTALLAFAPVHTGLSKGQPSVPVCVLIIVSLVVPNAYVAGVLLGVAACIKPQLALGFLLLAVAMKEWRKVASACLTGAGALSIGMLRLHPMALQTLRSNLADASAPSGLISGSSANPVWFQLITIDTLIPAGLHNAAAVAAVSAVIAIISAIAVWRTKNASIAIAVAAAATILLGYHRFYDAQILWLGLPVVALADRRSSIVLLAAFAVFLVPGQTMLGLWWHPSNTLSPLTSLLIFHEVLACLAIWLVFVAFALKPGFTLSGGLAPGRNPPL